MDDTDIYHFFEALPSDDHSIIIDTFVSLCWMHQQGHERPAVKLMRDVLQQANRQLTEDKTDLVLWVLENLPGNEKRFAQAVPMRSEFRQLFTDQ